MLQNDAKTVLLSVCHRLIIFGINYPGRMRRKHRHELATFELLFRGRHIISFSSGLISPAIAKSFLFLASFLPCSFALLFLRHPVPLQPSSSSKLELRAAKSW